MPYLNGTLVSAESDLYREANGEQFVILPADGDLSKAGFAMHGEMNYGGCPVTEVWARTLTDLSERLATEVDADAVYYDCVATSPPPLCFNAAHGHPVGGGTHHVDGYWSLLGDARKRLLAVKKQTVLSVEGGAEPYPFDAWLLTNGQGWTDPVRDVVYSGHKLRFSALETPFTLGGGLAYVRAVAHQLLWGRQFPWAANGILEHPTLVEFLKRMAAARSTGYEYLALGEMMRPATLTGPVPKIVCPWYPELKYDAVETSSWKGVDGSAALVFVNVTESPQTVTWQISPDALGLPRTRSTFALKPLYPEGTLSRNRIPLSQDGALSGVVSVRARDALVLKVAAQ